MLLTPGPCQTPEAVRLAAAEPDRNHRESDFLHRYAAVRRLLLEVNPGTQDWTPHLIGGSGTLAVEAMVTSLVQEGPVLVVANGYYSERIGAILAAHGIPHDELRLPWTQPASAARVIETLSAKPYQAVLLTHNETTTGALNPIREIGQWCRAQGLTVLVDAMSSFGADPIPTDAIDAFASSANKCLHGLAGVSFVLTRPGLPYFQATRSYSLDLRRYAGDVPLMTPPVPLVLALEAALKLYPGLELRRLDYLAKRNLIRKTLLEKGFELVLGEKDSSSTLTCVKMPDGVPLADWMAANERAGFQLYGCKGELAAEHFQVANMGDLSLADINTWCGWAAKWGTV